MKLTFICNACATGADKITVEAAIQAGVARASDRKRHDWPGALVTAPDPKTAPALYDADAAD